MDDRHTVFSVLNVMSCDVLLGSQVQKMMRFRGKGLTEEDQKDSGGEQKDEDEGLGPRSNVSLLDQHQHLKEKAEGSVDTWSVWGCSVSESIHGRDFKILVLPCLLGGCFNLF